MKKIILALIVTGTLFGQLKADGIKPYMVGHITICSGLINNYPADSTNWFYRKNHKVVQYFAYFLFPSAGRAVSPMNKPYLFNNPFEFYSGMKTITDNDNFVFENRWISPSGRLIAEKVVSWNKFDSENSVTVDNRQYVPYAFANYIGIDRIYSENGQEKMPDEQGLYHVNLYVNGELEAVTFFEMKD